MSFIEGFLSIATQGDEKFVKQWCKVDKNEFCWCANEGDATMLGKRDLSNGGQMLVLKAQQRFDIASDGVATPLQCMALSGAELDGWLDFFLKETSLKQASSAAAFAGATRTVSTTNLSTQLSKAAEKSLDRNTITTLIEDAIAREDFEICVQYRQYKRILDEIDAAVLAEEFEKCVELRNKKKALESQIPEFATKREQVKQSMLDSSAAAPAASSSAAAAATPATPKAAELNAIKSKIWNNSGGGPATPTSPKATLAGADNSESEESESLVKGGVRPKDKKQASAGGNTTPLGSARFSSGAATSAAAATAAAGGDAKKGVAAERANERAQKALEDRAKELERDAKWAKFAPKASDFAGAPIGGGRSDNDTVSKARSISGGFTLAVAAAKAAVAAKAAADEEESDSEGSGVKRTTKKVQISESEDASSIELKEKPKKRRVKKSEGATPEDGKKKKKKKKKKVDVMRTTWGGGALASQKVKFGDREVDNKSISLGSGAMFKNEWSSNEGGGAFRIGDVAHQRTSFDPLPKKANAAAAAAIKKSQPVGLSRAADAPDSSSANRAVSAANTTSPVASPTPKDDEKKKGGLKSLFRSFSKPTASPPKK